MGQQNHRGQRAHLQHNDKYWDRLRREFRHGYQFENAYGGQSGQEDGAGVEQLRKMIHANECRNNRLNNVLAYAKSKEPLD